MHSVDNVAALDHLIVPTAACSRPPSKQAQRHALGQNSAIVWLTGLSGAGKSTIAQRVGGALRLMGRRVVILDGDDLRAGLNKDLGFSPTDRNESMRRAAETARLMAEAGLLVIVALISPYRQGRAEARRIAGDIPFMEVFIDTPHIVCEDRDPKGLYARARDGEILNFTSISDPYEPPSSPDMVIKTKGRTVEQSASPLFSKLISFTTIELQNNSHLDIEGTNVIFQK